MLNTPVTSATASSGQQRQPQARGRALSVVIPCYNEEKGLEALIAHLKPILEATTLDWDVVFVDDGSRDMTREILHRAHNADPRFTAICFSRNFGKEIAVAAGLGYTKGDAVIIMDADLQHPPELIHTFIEKWREGYDVVYGQREDRDADNPLRRMFSLGFYRLFEKMSGTTLPDGAGDFRLMDRQAVAAMNRMSERARFNKGLYAWIGFKSTGVKFVVPPRFDGGGSRWRPRQLWRFALDGLISFSTVPLRIWSYIGMFVSGAAFGYVLFFLFKTLVFGVDVPGFPTLIISVLFLGGMQLISLGVIGEYLGRIYDEVKNRPLYLVSEEIGITLPPLNRRASDRVGQ